MFATLDNQYNEKYHCFAGGDWKLEISTEMARGHFDALLSILGVIVIVSGWITQKCKKKTLWIEHCQSVTVRVTLNKIIYSIAC